MAATLALITALSLGACGDDERPRHSSSGPGVIELSVRFDDGRGTERSGTLSCSPSAQRAGGDLSKRAPAARLCDSARALKRLLTRPRPTNRLCTQLYGGPQTARVAGTIDGAPVDRRFARTNGCRIGEFDRVQAILPPV
jgi:hypothetical protein